MGDFHVACNFKSMTKAILIEDEIYSRKLLQKMLQEHCKDIEFMGAAHDVSSGIALIKKTKPDVIFLDVEMPGGSGFDILNAFESPDFKTVFVTGYDHYAIKAIKYSAVDYLLKPVSLDELKNTIERLRDFPGNQKENIRFLNETIQRQSASIDRIILSDSKKHVVIQLEDIIFIKAEGTYVTFHTNGGKKYTAINTLSYYEELLPESSFFRIHKSYLINCSKVVKIETGRVGNVHLQEGVQLPVAARRKSAFISFLDQRA